MTDFNNTSNWEKKNNTTIIYRYDYEGRPHEGELEKEPHTLLVAVERLSVLDRTAWDIADDDQPDSVAGFHSSEFIRVTGKLDLARVHAFTPGADGTVTFDSIDVSIYPNTLEALQASSTHRRWSIIINKDERPEDGWLKDEVGWIKFYEADEYMVEPSLSAVLGLDQATFDVTVEKIKNGGTLRSARLEVLADLFQFGYEGAFARPLTTRNYGILCDSPERSTKGFTKARLEELLLEWSPTLSTPRTEADTLDNFPLDATDEETIACAVSKVATDVKGIRSRVDSFYQAAIFVIVILILGRVFDWLGM